MKIKDSPLIPRPPNSLAEPDLRLRDIHDLIDLRVRVHFKKEGRLGGSQIEQGYAFGVIITVSQEGDRRQLIFEMAVGPSYDQTHVPYCTTDDVDLVQALEDLAKIREEKERQAGLESQST